MFVLGRNQPLPGEATRLRARGPGLPGGQAGGGRSDPVRPGPHSLPQASGSDEVAKQEGEQLEVTGDF